jgi:protein SCO1/2
MEGKRSSLLSELNQGKPVMVNFIFTTCPTICPVLSATFASFQQQLSAEELADIRMVSISIDPEHDTPVRLREYAAMFNACPSWRFYTGSLEAIVAVQKAFEAYRGSKMNHAPLAFMRAGPGESWLRLEGFPKSSEMLAEYRALTGTDPTMAAR